MSKLLKKMRSTEFVLAGLILVASPLAVAGQTDGVTGAQDDKRLSREAHRQKGRHGYQYQSYSHQAHDRPEYHGGRFFTDQDRAFLDGYFADEFKNGRCPPGLDKKGDGCLPPGQAKTWQIGQPVPSELSYFDLPPRVLAGLGAPPPGYRFVRVAADVLLIAVGTGVVADAVYDLGLR